MALSENERWLLSFYRVSEISGAQFFGRMARVTKNEDIIVDMTKHFADESAHAWYWTQCIQQLGGKPMLLKNTYQEQYFQISGIPANIMEILAITQIFERRVLDQYNEHSRLPGIQPLIRETLSRIMKDEAWHLQWIKEALRAMGPEYGTQTIKDTLDRYTEIDNRVYKTTMDEFGDRLVAQGSVNSFEESAHV